MDGERTPRSGDVPTRAIEHLASIESWLIAHVARSANQSAAEIDVTLPFSHYALDSVATVELTADLEDLLELQLPPTLVWDYPTIALLARHLFELKARTP